MIKYNSKVSIPLCYIYKYALREIKIFKYILTSEISLKSGNVRDACRFIKKYKV